MIQDRNIHRDAQFLRKSITVPLIAPGFGLDQDEPIYAKIPRYDWRLESLSAYTATVATADLIVKAQAVPRNAAVGSPQLGQAAAATFTIEEFWKTSADGESFFNQAAVPAQAFGPRGIATVLDGFWGVWLLQVNQSADREVIRAEPIMAFPTEKIALEHCPRVVEDDGSGETAGRLAILTVNAVGGDFIAGTTDTDDGIVAAFNTAPQDGHVLTLPQSANPNQVQATLQQRTQDASGTNIIQGKGLRIPGAAMIVLSVRSAGAVFLTGQPLAVLEYRPWPAGGEGRSDSTRTKNRPSFVP